MSRRLKTEQPHQLKVFEQYFAMGDQRSFSKLSADTGVKLHTLRLWSSSFGWSQRIAERDSEVVRQASEKSMTDAVAQTELNLKMIRMAKMRLAKDISEGKAKGTIGDLPKLITLERELQSRPDPAAPSVQQPDHRGAVYILPDDGSGPRRYPTFVLPDNGSAVKLNPDDEN